MHKQTTTARATRTPPNKKVNKLTMAVHVRYLSNTAQVSMLINQREMLEKHEKNS